MAHTLCANKHSMWNGDGKVCVDAYPVEFVKYISKENPDRKFGDKDNDYSLLVDIYDSCPENEPEIWRCMECLSLAIFFHDGDYKTKKRYDYVIDDMENLPDKTIYSKWEEYFAENYDAFAYVSDDKTKIVVTNNDHIPIRLYRLKWKIEFLTKR